jgi:hypothetical protein
MEAINKNKIKYKYNKQVLKIKKILILKIILK